MSTHDDSRGATLPLEDAVRRDRTVVRRYRGNRRRRWAAGALPALVSAVLGGHACAGIEGAAPIPLMAPAVPASPAPGETVCVTPSAGVPTEEGGASLTAASGNGRFLAFTSNEVPGFVPEDTDEGYDVFVLDFRTGMVELVSIDSRERQVKRGNWVQDITPDGRFVLFVAETGKLVPDDRNNKPDVFVRDRREGITRLVSRGDHGQVGNGSSDWASISDDGRFVSFASDASNLVPRDRNGTTDVFVRDLRRHRTRLVSVTDTEHRANGSSSHPSISGDGRFVAFTSDAGNLAPRFNGAGGLDWASVYVRDRRDGTTEPISVDSRERFGSQGGLLPHISRYGRFVVFESSSPNLVRADTNGRVDVFIRDRKRGITHRVNLTNTGSQSRGESLDVALDPRVSADGRLVAFTGRAGDLVPGDNGGSYDVFVRDRRKATTRMVSVNSDGELAGGASFGTAMPDNGSYVAFTTRSNLSPADLDTSSDVCVHGLP